MEFDEKVQEVQKTFTTERIKRFAIASPELLKQSDYVKSLYMRMLCTLMRCGSPTEEQVWFVQRLTAGAEMTDNFTELMRQSMNMDAESITVFIEALSPNDMKYYFVLDGCITCVLGTGNDRFAMLAECAELLGVAEADLQYLVRAAKAIVLQSSEAFDEAKDYQTIKTKKISLFYQLRKFYNGVLENTEERFYLYFADEQRADLSEYDLSADDILIENAIIELDNDLKFEHRNKIEFRNCQFTNCPSCCVSLKFVHTQMVVFSGCLIENFNYYFCTMENVSDLNVQKCTFKRCNTILFMDLYSLNGTSYMNVNLSNNTIIHCNNPCMLVDTIVLANINYCKQLLYAHNHFDDCANGAYGVWIREKCQSVIDNDNTGVYYTKRLP